MRKIALGGTKGVGKYAIVSDEDYEYLSQFRWHMQGRYVGRTFTENSKVKNTTMHRELMKFPVGLIVDHINGDPLDNRRENLRTCTQSQNLMNQRLGIRNKTGFKGVSFISGSNKWIAMVHIDGKRQQIGRFESPEEAARAYDYFAVKSFGEFAKLNFPNEIPTEPVIYKRKRTSTYLGVSLDANSGSWRALIGKGGNRLSIGSYKSEYEAAEAYNKKAIELYGSAARLNDL